MHVALAACTRSYYTTVQRKKPNTRLVCKHSKKTGSELTRIRVPEDQTHLWVSLTRNACRCVYRVNGQALFTRQHYNRGPLLNFSMVEHVLTLFWTNLCERNCNEQ